MVDGRGKKMEKKGPIEESRGREEKVSQGRKKKDEVREGKVNYSKGGGDMCIK